MGAEESEIRVGFVTYAKEIHFYNVKVCLFYIYSTHYMIILKAT